MTDRQRPLQPPCHTTSRKYRNIVFMALMERTAFSATRSKRIQSATKESVSKWTIRCHLQYSEMPARRPLLCLHLNLNLRRLRLQCCTERRGLTSKWHNVVFSDEPRFCPLYHDGRIRAWGIRAESLLNCCVMDRHICPVPGVMVWGGIWFYSRSP